LEKEVLPMDNPMSGDIFPARQAIELIDQIDLLLPIEIPPVPPEAEPDNVAPEEHRWLLAEIARLKKEKNAYILAHNYAPRDIQDVADAVGDSLFLAQQGAASDADILVEASVLFMNEILAIMKKPRQRVLAPDLGALCSLAAHADVNKIRRWKSDHPGGIVISYVNTYLDVKAESDYATSQDWHANARRTPPKSFFTSWSIPPLRSRYFFFPMFILDSTRRNCWSSKINLLTGCG
jgi:hypothetical protein